MEVIKGSNVIVRKPKDVNTHPTWVSGMDEYSGGEYTVVEVKVGSDGKSHVAFLKDVPYVFNVDWLVLVDDNISVENDALNGFINSWKELMV